MKEGIKVEVLQSIRVIEPKTEVVERRLVESLAANFEYTCKHLHPQIAGQMPRVRCCP
jgi:hypothetical protein